MQASSRWRQLSELYSSYPQFMSRRSAMTKLERRSTGCFSAKEPVFPLGSLPKGKKLGVSQS